MDADRALQANYDYVIQNGRVMDPSNNRDMVANVGIKDGKIAAIVSAGVKIQGGNTIDASGLIVCPGFIDIHCHEDPKTFSTSDAGKKAMSSSRVILGAPNNIMKCRLLDGVTTIVGGNCGAYYYPLSEYYNAIEEDGILINYVSYAGHNVLRETLGSNRYSALDDVELAQLGALIEKEMRAGAAGVSFGVMYSPGVNLKEIKYIAKLVKDRNGIIAAHVRDRGNTNKTLEAVDEFVQVANETGVQLQISHIGSIAGFGDMMEKCLQLMADASAKGANVYGDVYPYTASMANIGSAALDGKEFLKVRGTDYHDYALASDVIIDGKLVMKAGERFTEELWNTVRTAVLDGNVPDPRCINHGISLVNVKLAMKHPLIMIASDGTVISNENGQKFGHPRVSGTHSKFLGHFVRDNNEMDLMEGLFKCTTLPAKALGLKHKGTIAEGADADITIFDAEMILDKAEYGSMFRDPPQGVRYVMVNGVLLVKDSEFVSDVKHGRIIGKTGEARGGEADVG